MMNKNPSISFNLFVKLLKQYTLLSGITQWGTLAPREGERIVIQRFDGPLV